MQLPVAIYARISDDRVGSGLGVARQEEDCRRLAEARGWTIGDVLVDNDISAYRGRRRPSYELLIEGLKAGRYGGVVAWHPDRLHRSPTELEAFIDVIDASGAVVATVQAGDLDLSTASGRMTARIVGAVARHESEQKSERIRRKHLQLAAGGKVAGGGTRPFGFNADLITVRDDEAEVIREMAGRVLANESMRSIIGDLDQRGITTSTGRPWTLSGARRMLMSGRIAGLRTHRGEVSATAEWPAILDRPTWEAVRRILGDPSRRTNHSPRSYLLTGLAYCGRPECGARLHAQPKDDKRRCYACMRLPRSGGCSKIRILAEDFEQFVVDTMLAALDGGRLEQLLTVGGPVAPAASAVELSNVERQLDELADMFARGQLSRREWLRARGGLDERHSALTVALAAGTQGSALRVLTGAGTLEERWERLLFGQQHAVVRAMIDRVVVGPAVKGRNFFDPGRLAPPRGDIVWRV